MNELIPTLGIVGLVVAYIALAVLLLGLNLHSTWHWSIKSVTNVAIVALCWVTYQSWPTLLGWPTERDLPSLFYLHGVLVEEPDRIYLWGTDLERGLGRTVPRSFSLAYEPELHDRVDKATRKLRKGLPVIGQVTSSNSTAASDSLEQVKVTRTEVEFLDAPQSLVPGKN